MDRKVQKNIRHLSLIGLNDPALVADGVKVTCVEFRDPASQVTLRCQVPQRGEHFVSIDMKTGEILDLAPIDDSISPEVAQRLWRGVKPRLCTREI